MSTAMERDAGTERNTVMEKVMDTDVNMDVSTAMGKVVDMVRERTMSTAVERNMVTDVSMVMEENHPVPGMIYMAGCGHADTICITVPAEGRDRARSLPFYPNGRA